MGFSISGSAGIVVIGVFLSFSLWYGAAADSFERVSEATDDRNERSLGTKNVDVRIVTAAHDGSDLTVEVNNTGTRTLALSETDLLFDNEYQSGWRADATIAGDGDTDLWQPGERLSYTVTTDAPNRVTVATEFGVSASTGVA